MAGLPSMPLFFGDLLASTATWDGEERALYVVLLAYQWVSGPLPIEPKRIARMCQYDPANFNTLWKTVGKKFVETDEGLVNVRLEQHRERAKQISEKRANAGAKGGATRAANAKQLPADSTSNTSSNGEANASGLYSHPIQSNPIQTNPDQALPSVAHSERAGSDGKVPRGTLDGWEFIDQRMRPKYPRGLYRSTAWVAASRTAERLVTEEGIEPDRIIAGVERYFAQQEALGNEGTQFVLNPDRFLTEKQFDEPFPLPVARQAREELPMDRIRRMNSDPPDNAIEGELSHG